MTNDEGADMQHDESPTPKFTQLLTVDQAYKYLGVGRTTIYQLLNEKRLGVVRIHRRVMIPIEELDRLIAASWEPAEN
jgi:excisionase family DNA binding protein